MNFRALPHADPRDSCIAPNQCVVFYPSAARLDEEKCWQVPIHGWIYRPVELSRLRRAALWSVKRLLRRRVPRDHPNMPLFERRAGAFLADNNRGVRIRIRVGESVVELKNSRASGHFRGIITLPTADYSASQRAGWLSFRAITRADDRRHFDGRVLLLPPTGLSVISDIDDTIKITGVLQRRTMLASTFLRDFSGVPKMAALYRRWEAERGASIHYVSASPWQLYPFLQEFMDQQAFPSGTFHLRDFRLMPRDLRKSIRSSRRVKQKHIRALFEQFPRRRFILVGDSGESDAALYAAMARRFPRQVEKIFIRNITGDPPDCRRWQKMFAHIPTARFQLFSDPSEIE